MNIKFYSKNKKNETENFSFSWNKETFYALKKTKKKQVKQRNNIAG